MKVLIPSSTQSVSDETTGNSELDIHLRQVRFSETAQGKHLGLVPVKFNVTDADNPLIGEKLVQVRIEGESSDNNRGARRVMLKVSLPYTRAVQNADGTYKVDTASSGEITAHVVFSIPSRCRQDLLEQNDVRISSMASMNIALAATLLRSLTNAMGSNVVYGHLHAEGNNPLYAIKPSQAQTVIVDDQPTATKPGIENFSLLGVTSGYGSLETAEGYTSELFGSDGLSVACNLGAASFAAAPRDPLVRGLFGLVPIEENSAIVPRTAIVHDNV